MNGASSNGDSSWNDIACFQKLGGVICKRHCIDTSNGQTCGGNGWEISNGREYKAIPVPTSGNYWQARK